MEQPDLLIYLTTLYKKQKLVICTQRQMILNGWLKKDHKMLYYIAGLLASSAIFIEQEKRRTELALYALPKGLDSFYQLLRDRQWIFSIPHFDVLMVCVILICLNWGFWRYSFMIDDTVFDWHEFIAGKEVFFSMCDE